jgi:phytoene synthase
MMAEAATGAVMWSYAECHRIARGARSNFYYAFYLLPKPKRDGLAALYAFMRLIDDVADDAENVETRSGA